MKELQGKSQNQLNGNQTGNGQMVKICAANHDSCTGEFCCAWRTFLIVSGNKYRWRKKLIPSFGYYLLILRAWHRLERMCACTETCETCVLMCLVHSSIFVIDFYKDGLSPLEFINSFDTNLFDRLLRVQHEFQYEQIPVNYYRTWKSFERTTTATTTKNELSTAFNRFGFLFVKHTKKMKLIKWNWDTFRCAHTHKPNTHFDAINACVNAPVNNIVVNSWRLDNDTPLIRAKCEKIVWHENREKVTLIFVTLIASVVDSWARERAKPKYIIHDDLILM